MKNSDRSSAGNMRAGVSLAKILILACAVWAPAVGASAAEKILMFGPGSTEQTRRAAVEKLGGVVVTDLRLIDAVAARFERQPSAHAFAALAMPALVEDDSYSRWTLADEHEPQWPEVGRFLQRPPVVPDAEDALRRAGPAVAVAAAASEVQWGVARLNAPAVWDRLDGKGVKVAVLDTGIDRRHPDLKGNYRGGANLVWPALDPDDDNGHGTHVAGIIAAVRDGKGVVGVAPRAELYAVKVVDSDGGAQESWIVKGLEWCVDNGMQIVNISLGSSRYTEALQRAVVAARKAGLTIVCAAGNNGGKVVYPAAYPESIAVTAGDAKDQLRPSSSRGPEVAFIAPGTEILSTYMGSRWEVLSGTSMAAPHVTGLAALAVQAGARSPDAVLDALKRAASPLPGLAPEAQGFGLIDAVRIASPHP